MDILTTYQGRDALITMASSSVVSVQELDGSPISSILLSGPEQAEIFGEVASLHSVEEAEYVCKAQADRFSLLEETALESPQAAFTMMEEYEHVF
jgi:hypothetical protein